MTTDNIYDLVKDLTNEIKNLRVDLRETKEVVKQLLRKGTSPIASDDSSERVPTPPANIVSSGEGSDDRLYMFRNDGDDCESLHDYLGENNHDLDESDITERIDTGVRDSKRKRLYVNDRVRLNTNSSGIFFLNRQYRKGDIVTVIGPTKNGYIKVIDASVPGIRHTVRKGAKVTNLD